MKIFLNLLLIGLLCISICTPKLGPQAAVQETLNKIKVTLTKNPKISDEQLQKILLPIFDLTETSKRCLGGEWNELTLDNQNTFVKLFSKLLLKTYISKVRKINRISIFFKEEIIRDELASVKVNVYDKDEHIFIFKLHLTLNEWKIYDLLIENIGMVESYRQEFAQTIRSKGFSGLLEDLTTKVQ